MADTILKTCPCCGGKARTKSAKYNTLGSYGNTSTQKQWFGVYCTICRLGQPSRFYFSKQDAINAWNERTNIT